MGMYRVVKANIHIFAAYKPLVVGPKHNTRCIEVSSINNIIKHIALNKLNAAIAVIKIVNTEAAAFLTAASKKSITCGMVKNHPSCYISVIVKLAVICNRG